MKDAPDPTDEEWSKAELQEASEHSVHVESLFVDDTGNEETPAWGKALNDEHDKSNGLRNISPSLFAAWKVVASSCRSSERVVDLDINVHSYSILKIKL